MDFVRFTYFDKSRDGEIGIDRVGFGWGGCGNRRGGCILVGNLKDSGINIIFWRVITTLNRS